MSNDEKKAVRNPSKKEFAGAIHPHSITVMYLEMYFNKTKLASGTAFCVKSSKGPILITNRHNFTGRDQNTDKPLHSHCATPNNVRFQILSPKEPIWYGFNLYRDEEMTKPVWVEHSEFSSKVDVVGVLLPELKETIYQYVDTKKDWHTWGVADKIHVVGYPFGMNDNFAIWATGYIASEPATDYRGMPSFLIDCRTRQGQSGSMVIARFKPGDTVMHKGKIYSAQKEMVHFLGIYSGRINKEADIGIVWKMATIRDIANTIENSDKVVDVKYANHLE